MKDNKGFTLIELLAVIVILAIIALIATPVILGIIDDSKNSSYKRSIDMYASAVKNSVANAYIKSPSLSSLVGDYTSESLENLLAGIGVKIEYTGTKVNCGIIKIYDNMSIYLTQCTVEDSNSVLSYEYGKGTSTSEQAIVPNCTYSDDDTSGGISTGDLVTCGTETFNVIKEPSGGIVTMLRTSNLDVGAVEFDEFEEYGYWAPEDILDTSTYTACSGYPCYVYDSNASIYTYVNSYVNTLNITSATGRLIKYEELEALGCSGSGHSCSNAPSWVYQASYWSGSADSWYGVWRVDHYDGSMGVNDFDSHEDIYGARPVIELSESLIKTK